MTERAAPPRTTHPAVEPRAAPLRVIAGLARALSQARTDPAAILEITARTLIHELADGCVIRLGAGRYAYAHRDLECEEFLREALPAIPLQRLPAGGVLATGRPLILTRVPPELVDELSPESRAFVRRFSLTGVLAVPIRGRAGVLGVITAWRDRTALPFVADDINALHVCSEHVALALDHAAAFQELQTREARFALAARATEDVLWDWDLATDTILWNEAASTTLGWPPDQVEATLEWWNERVHDDDRARVLAGIDAAIRDNPASVRWQDEYRFRRGDGSYATIVDRGYVLRDASGRPRRFVGSMQDISARVEATRRLAEREERYRAFIATSSDGIWCFAADPPISVDLPVEDQIDAIFARATLVECNDVTARTYGYAAAAELLGARLTQFLPPDDPRSRALLRAFLAGGHRLTDGESRERDRHGRERVLLNNIVGVVEAGRLARAWGTQRDLTDRRRSDTLLRESQQLFARAFGKNPNAMSLHALSTCEFLDVNEALAAAVGLPREQMLGKTPGELGIFVDPGDPPRLFAALRRRGSVRDAEVRVRGAGETHTILWSAEILEYQGRRCVLTASTDITARKRAEEALQDSEERFRQIAANIDQVFWLTEFDPERIAYVSPACERAWGRTPAELQSDARAWLNAIHPDDRDAVERGFTDWLASGTERWEQEYRVVHPDGSVRWIRDRGALIRDAAGRPWRAAGIADDITERRAAERERERLVADLRAAVAVRDDFLALASHELRTPLTALGFHLEQLARLVDRGPGDREQLAAKVAGAVRQVDRLGALVDSLLHVGELGRGRLRLDLADFDLAAHVRELAARADDDARSARCELRVDGPPSLPVRMDRLQIDHALGHLLANALKYGAGRPVDLRVRALGERVEIEVEDRGIGIDEADARRIFDRFERAVPSNNYGGFGLGLYLTHQIVEAHGGVIDVSSRPGQGATFRVRLPRAAAQPPMEDP